MRRLVGIWCAIRPALIRREPQTLEEFERQSLVWNSFVTYEESRQLGEHTHIDWARWDTGPASSLAQCGRCHIV